MSDVVPTEAPVSLIKEHTLNLIRVPIIVFRYIP